MSQTITTGQLSSHLGITVPAELLIDLGIEPAEKVKRGYYWRVSDLPEITSALASHIQSKDVMDDVPEKKQVTPKSKPAASPAPDLDDDDEL